ncbi:hypothetical protein [Bermanella sp. R86510]|uniref:hypothetical protein n=1 Tax=unclassified Bermanella TaxID=2627862 RepID=UPI0037CC7614
MGEFHKKAMLAIFTMLFLFIATATIFVAIEIQQFAVVGILLVALIVIGLDINWVRRSQQSHE